MMWYAKTRRSLMADDSLPTKSAAPVSIEQPLDAPIDSLAIRRLIEEVRSETMNVQRSYNRTFNRHNR
jgi:hypothetical protein